MCIGKFWTQILGTKTFPWSSLRKITIGNPLDIFEVKKLFYISSLKPCIKGFEFFSSYFCLFVFADSETPNLGLKNSLVRLYWVNVQILQD